MTGGAFFAPAADNDEEYEMGPVGETHAVQWIGTAGVKGPKWARLPLLTVGMLGIQCVWSIEMGYASPYLLELGLSKSFMSLVFMAGPLSGLIVQPLVGIFADRSRSPLGRRRPFMLAGCLICVSAMMLLGWSREVASIFGGGQWLAIVLAVWAIYCIDFSINAVMSTDRALVVDTLPPREQEEGSAWAGRMFGFGSVAGFFVGNLDLAPVLPFLGKTQLQILSFLTSTVLMVTHSFTSWAVSERVLLRDDRPQSKSSLKSNLKSIWENMFSLPPGIRTVCIVQFFASLGWFPILFFTTVWVSEIYKSSVPSDGIDPATFDSRAVRSGARALLLQALVNIITSIGMPFLVAESGVQPSESVNGYEPIEGSASRGIGPEIANGNGNGPQANVGTPPNSASWKRAREDLENGTVFRRLFHSVQEMVNNVKKGEWGIPIKGLTLVRVWWISQFIFAAAMAGSWFVTSVGGAYVIIATTGFCWALSQWAPYSLLGELILIDGSIQRNQSINLPRMRGRRNSSDAQSRPSSALFDAEESSHSIIPPSNTNLPRASTPLHSRHASRTSLVLERSNRDSRDRTRPSSPSSNLDRPAKFDREKFMSHKSNLSLEGEGLSPLVIQGDTPVEPAFGSTVILRHSDEMSRSEGEHDEYEMGQVRGNSSSTHHSPRASGDYDLNGAKGTADKAGVILGIHNVFLVLPQFIVTVLSSVIFWLMEPSKSLPTHHPGSVPVPDTNTTVAIGAIANSSVLEDTASATIEVAGQVVKRAAELVSREGVDVDVSSPDAVGLIFRIGGVSAAIGGWICWRLARDWARGQGI
ncbi:solute carrier family 45, member 1/2/4 [Cryptococcus neoformans Ze90-1]|nr:solute carrier family 45, member 1/2/4 [Cryptococcus neoformans var. grubii Ze90-1]